jgi:hypothetical protein
MSNIRSTSLLSLWKGLKGFQMEAFVKQYLTWSLTPSFGGVYNNGMVG